jgi:tetratricopeptide (TPR) repeat protein
VNLLIGRAQAEGTAHDYWAAIDDLNAAIDVDPKRADALVLRAASYRHVDTTGAVELALDDVTNAIAINPNFADAFLERGTLYAMRGDYDGARKDWDKAQQLAPESYVSQQAKSNLAQLQRLMSPTAQPASSPKPESGAPKP